MISLQANVLFFDLEQLEDHCKLSGVVDRDSFVPLIDQGVLEVQITSSYKSIKPVRCVLDKFASTLTKTLDKLIKEDPDNEEMYFVTVSHTSTEKPIDPQYVVYYNPDNPRSRLTLIWANNNKPLALRQLYNDVGLETPPVQIYALPAFDASWKWVEDMVKGADDSVGKVMLEDTGLCLTTYATDRPTCKKYFSYKDYAPLSPCMRLNNMYGNVLQEINRQRNSIKKGASNALMFRLEYVREVTGIATCVTLGSAFTFDENGGYVDIKTSIPTLSLYRNWFNSEAIENNAIAEPTETKTVWYKEGDRYYQGILRTDEKGKTCLVESCPVSRNEFRRVTK